MYKEISAKDAFEAYSEGKRVICLEREEDINGVINSFTLDSMFKRFAALLVFLVDVPDVSISTQDPVSDVDTESHIPEAEDVRDGVPISNKKAKVDIGKIIALHDAGWTFAKIADEMKLTVKQVANYIYGYKDRDKEDSND